MLEGGGMADWVKVWGIAISDAQRLFFLKMRTRLH